MDVFLHYNLQIVWDKIFNYCGFSELEALCNAHPEVQGYLQNWLCGPFCKKNHISDKFDLYNWTQNLPQPYKDNRVYTDGWDPSTDLIDLRVEGAGGGNYVALFGTGPTSERQETILLLGENQPHFTIQKLSRARFVVTSQFVAVVGKLGTNPMHCSVFDRKSLQCLTLETVRDVFEVDDRVVYRTDNIAYSRCCFTVLDRSEEETKFGCDIKCSACRQHLILTMSSLSTVLKLCTKCKTLTEEHFQTTKKNRVIKVPQQGIAAGDSLQFNLRTVQETAFVTVTKPPVIGSDLVPVLGISCISLNTGAVELSHAFPEGVFDLQFAVSSSYLVLQYWNKKLRKNCLITKHRVSGFTEQLELSLTCRTKAVEIVNDRVIIVIPEYSQDEENQSIFIKDLLQKSENHFEIPMESANYYIVEEGRGYATAQWEDQSWFLRTFLHPEWSDQRFEDTFFQSN